MIDYRTDFTTVLEKRLAQLKREFSHHGDQETETRFLWQLRFDQLNAWLRANSAQFNVRDASSLYAVPTSFLNKAERKLHRIWLGGFPPSEVTCTVWQWQQAIISSGSDFGQPLWVWNEAQVSTHPAYVAQPGSDPCQLGALFIDECLVPVWSLEQLATQHCPHVLPFLSQLHHLRFFATLSDYFRLAIISVYGGVYLDADTLPAQPATLFLARPELPDIVGPQGKRISWMNLFLDETGMIIAHQGNREIWLMHNALTEIYLRWPAAITEKTPAVERAIFEPFYQLWCQQLNVSQISHQHFSQHYAIWGYDEAQPRICGIKGMRLQEDILAGKTCPLSETEQQHYQQSLGKLDRLNWTFSDPLALEEALPVFCQTEAPPLAFSPQLRAEIPYYHYYRVLSQDSNLDKVNDLFADYLIAHNQRQIAQGKFWQPVTSGHRPELWFKPGVQTTADEQRKMAHWILATSYLEYCSVDNPQGSDIVSLQHRQNIAPYLTTIFALYDPQGKMVGFINAGTAQMLSQPDLPYPYREEVRPLDFAYDDFVANHAKHDDYFIASIALAPEARGKGYFSPALAFMAQQAMVKKSSRITLCVWASSPAAALYRHSGFREQGRMAGPVSRFQDTLLFMALPL